MVRITGPKLSVLSVVFYPILSEFSDNDASEDVEFDDDDAGKHVEIGDEDPGEHAEFGNDNVFVPYAPVSP